MVKFFEGLHTFTKETQKLDNRMTSHFLKRHGLMSPSSSFRFCYSGCCNSLDILLEYKSKLHFFTPLLTLRLFKSIEIMWARKQLSSEVVKSIFEVLADWVIELEKGNAEAIKPTQLKKVCALVNVATENIYQPPLLLKFTGESSFRRARHNGGVSCLRLWPFRELFDYRIVDHNDMGGLDESRLRLQHNIQMEIRIWHTNGDKMSYVDITRLKSKHLTRTKNTGHITVMRTGHITVIKSKHHSTLMIGTEITLNKEELFYALFNMLTF